MNNRKKLYLLLLSPIKVETIAKWEVGGGGVVGGDGRKKFKLNYGAFMPYANRNEIREEFLHASAPFILLE